MHVSVHIFLSVLFKLVVWHYNYYKLRNIITGIGAQFVIESSWCLVRNSIPKLHCPVVTVQTLASNDIKLWQYDSAHIWGILSLFLYSGSGDTSAIFVYVNGVFRVELVPWAANNVIFPLGKLVIRGSLSYYQNLCKTNWSHERISADGRAWLLTMWLALQTNRR